VAVCKEWNQETKVVLNAIQ